MKYIQDNFKKLLILSVPISLVLSIYFNSLICILYVIFFIPDIFRDFSKHNTPINRKVFFVFLSFIGTYLIGFIIDVHYGIVNIKKAERLLPFIIFPLFFLFSNPIKYFKNPKTPLLVYAFFIVICNLFLLGSFLISAWTNYNDLSFENSRWEKKNIQIKKSGKESKIGIIPTVQISGTTKKNNQELVYNRFFNINKDTFSTRSVYVKSSDKVWLLIRQFDGVNHMGAWFYPKNGEIGYVQKNLKADIKNLENGWYRISLTNSINKSTTRERFQITFVDDNKSYSLLNQNNYVVYLGGAQLELAKNPSVYNPLEHRKIWDDFDRSDLLEPINGHPTYYSLYLILSILVILIFSSLGIIKYVVLLFNLFFLIILGSKAGIITIFLVLIILSVHNILKRSGQKNRLVWLLFTVATIFTLFISRTVNRFYQAFDSVSGNYEGSVLSTDQRIKMWESIRELPIDKLLIGGGNIHAYEILSTGMEFKLNSHNQYLEALIVSGVIGLFLLLVFVFGIFFVDQKAKRNSFLIIFCFIVAFNLMFENLLNRQLGIVFIAYFLPYFYVLKKRL